MAYNRNESLLAAAEDVHNLQQQYPQNPMT